MGNTCLKCGHEESENNPLECPNCGAIYAKVEKFWATATEEQKWRFLQNNPSPAQKNQTTTSSVKRIGHQSGSKRGKSSGSMSDRVNALAGNPERASSTGGEQQSQYTKESASGENPYKRKVSRQAVRKLANRHILEIQREARMGGNIYQKSLDQEDEVTELAEDSGMTEEETARLLDVYRQEIAAITDQIQDDLQQNNEAAQNAALESELLAIDQEYQREVNTENWGTILGGIIFIIVLIAIW